ncbi:MAG: hypothetical protein JNK29_05835, partial [Anaerolineales bacterium]|nr:hypothetical protein [Anaerolineales bacterium]
GIVPGPVCGPQFQSPYPGLPTATSTPTVTATVACPAGQFFDPALNQCRPVSTAPSATPTLTVPPSVTPLPLASATFTPSRTPTTTRTATPTATPTITNTPLPTPIILALSVSPSVISATTYINGTPIAPLCGFSFQAEISDTVGVAQAAIRWTVLDAKPSVVQGPNDEPIFQDGTPYYGYISGFSVPAAGSITWSVVATNTLGLTNSRSGASITDISGAGCTVGVAMVP